MKPTVAIIGASTRRHKFGNKAVRAYLRQGWEVYPVHPEAQVIEGQRAFRSIRDVPVERLDRVSIYLPPVVGLQVIDELPAKPAHDVWLNPGAASKELVQRARELGLNVVLGCSIVAIGVDPEELD
jgi:predicted CoA-binding protein